MNIPGLFFMVTWALGVTNLINVWSCVYQKSPELIFDLNTSASHLIMFSHPWVSAWEHENEEYEHKMGIVLNYTVGRYFESPLTFSFSLWISISIKRVFSSVLN